MPVNRAALESQGTIETASGCDHQCRVIRALQGTPQEWRGAIERGTSRWETRCDSEIVLDEEGRIEFGLPLEQLPAKTVVQLMTDVEGE
jgi:hypothetical protein